MFTTGWVGFREDGVGGMKSEFRGVESSSIWEPRIVLPAGVPGGGDDVEEGLAMFARTRGEECEERRFRDRESREWPSADIVGDVESRRA